MAIILHKKYNPCYISIGLKSYIYFIYIFWYFNDKLFKLMLLTTTITERFMQLDFEESELFAGI